MNYYDPKTYAAVDPTKVVQSISGYDEWNAPQYAYSFNGSPVSPVSGAGVNGWGEWLAGEGATANARSYNRLQQYMGDLSKTYGLGADDFIKGFQSYGATYNPGATDEYGNIHGFGRDPNMGWWGEDAMIRALGQGLDKANPDAAYKGSWQNMWDQQRELGQQNEIATTWQANQDRYSQSADFMNDLPTILAGLGMVAGVGGLANAFGGSIGLPGADVVGSDWASGLSSAMNPGSAGTTALSDLAVGNPGTSAVGAEVNLSGSGGGMGDEFLPDFNYADDVIDVGTGGGGGMSAADAIREAIANGGSEFGTTSAGGPLANGWQGALANALSGIPNLPPGVSTAIRSLLGGAAGGAGGAAGSTAIGRILGGTGTASDWASVLGQGATGVLDYLGNEKRFDYAKGVDERNWNAGAPSRSRYEAAMSPGFDINSMPGYKQAMDTATETYLRKLSATGGNPAGIGAAPSQTMAYTMGTVGLPAWQQYVNQNANAGGIGALSQGSTGTGMGLADASGGTYNSLGKSIGAITNPTTSLRDLLSLNSPV